METIQDSRFMVLGVNKVQVSVCTSAGVLEGCAVKFLFRSLAASFAKWGVTIGIPCSFSLLLFNQCSGSVVSNSLQPHWLQHARLPCPSLSLRVNSCPLNWWCHPAISSSVIPFTSCLQSFPASGSFPLSQLFTSGCWNIGVSASASVLPMNIQDWFPLGLTGLISLLSKGLSRVFSNTLVQKHQFFGTQPSYGPTLIFVHDYQKNYSFDYSFVGKMMSLLFNMPHLSQLFFQGARVF